jgi:predicted acyl esterase
LIAYVVLPLLFMIAVTNALALPLLAGLAPLPPAKSPFSRSAWTNPLTGQFPAAYQKGPQGRYTLHWGPEHQARLLLPVIP